MNINNLIDPNQNAIYFPIGVSIKIDKEYFKKSEVGRQILKVVEAYSESQKEWEGSDLGKLVKANLDKMTPEEKRKAEEITKKIEKGPYSQEDFFNNRIKF